MSNFSFPSDRMRIRNSCRTSVFLLPGSSRCFSEWRARGLSRAAITSSSLIMLDALPDGMRGVCAGDSSLLRFVAFFGAEGFALCGVFLAAFQLLLLFEI